MIHGYSLKPTKINSALHDANRISVIKVRLYVSIGLSMYDKLIVRLMLIESYGESVGLFIFSMIVRFECFARCTIMR